MSISCQRINSCPLFKAFSMKSSLKFWQTCYCERGFDRCERWRLVQAGKPVPVNLLPNGHMLDVPLDQLEPKHML